jgi:hypothetical protein
LLSHIRNGIVKEAVTGMQRKLHNDEGQNAHYVPPSTLTCSVVVSTTVTRPEGKKRMESMRDGYRILDGNVQRVIPIGT